MKINKKLIGKIFQKFENIFCVYKQNFSQQHVSLVPEIILGMLKQPGPYLSQTARTLNKKNYWSTRNAINQIY